MEKEVNLESISTVDASLQTGKDLFGKNGPMATGQQISLPFKQPKKPYGKRINVLNKVPAYFERSRA